MILFSLDCLPKFTWFFSAFPNPHFQTNHHRIAPPRASTAHLLSCHTKRNRFAAVWPRAKKRTMSDTFYTLICSPETQTSCLKRNFQYEGLGYAAIRTHSVAARKLACFPPVFLNTSLANFKYKKWKHQTRHMPIPRKCRAAEDDALRGSDSEICSPSRAGAACTGASNSQLLPVIPLVLLVPILIHSKKKKKKNKAVTLKTGGMEWKTDGIFPSNPITTTLFSLDHQPKLLSGTL